MNDYKSFSELKEELGSNYDFKLYEMGISALKEVEKLQQENERLNGAIKTYDILLKSNVEENKLLKERIEYLERSNNRRESTILKQRQEICDLEDNWNKLREIIRKKQDYYRYVKDNRYRKFLSELLNKMQELQGSDNDGKSNK
jgi:hypothetical protein